MSDRRRSRVELRKGAPAFVDDANTGRRTGKFIPTVQRDEDGFESIEGLFGSQAYAVDAPKQRARKQLATVVEYSYIEEEDEEGASMELTRVEGDVDIEDYDIPEVQPAPAPVRRTALRRSSPPIDDHVPSPQRFSQSSQSTRRAKAPLNSARRSHSLMRSSSPVQPDPEPEEDESEPEPEPEPEPEKSRRRTITRRSTLGNGDHSVDMELDEPTMSVIHEQDEDLDVGVGSPLPPSPLKDVKTEKAITTNKPASSSGNKSNAASSSNKPTSKTPQSDIRALTPTPPPPADDDMEDDIANGLAQLDAGADEENEPEPEPPAKSGSKGKGKEKEKPAAKGKAKDKGKAKEKRPRDDDGDGQKSPKKAKAGKGKENTRETTVEPVGRRKKRDFSDPEEGPLLVPLIRAIERPVKPPTMALTKKGTKKGGRRVKVKKEEEDRELGEGVFGAPRTQEDGMDEETEELGVVMDYATGREVERRIAFPGARVDFNPSDGPFSFQKIFGDSDFFAAGVMKIPVVDFDTGKL
ncbi:hypothetical protein BN14_08248 [Rhizoctonia solani AG-1 IB]|uniref:Uncharacterized protein n=1 Tax=Thanatephorus cucumeris (strain AG1-IB / isolate 7/3/14) TaxID=1108050 RepID=M5C537_THACB|nr:hypothetical protein BN14_08248 [Rhizoctonia solani AG-1 IB]